MYSLLLVSIVAFILISLILFLVVLFSMQNFDGEKVLPLESGFWCLSGGSMKFSIQFFTVLLIFVLFDIEVVLLSPMVFFYSPQSPMFFLIFFFILGTLLLEWWWGKLTWFD